MDKALAVALTLMLTGCNPPGMTRAEVIAAVKECEAGGLDAEIIQSAVDSRVLNVVCVTKEPGR
jgi:glycosyltransferase A (GT-A) superfamily protein (DUF2064 family)